MYGKITLEREEVYELCKRHVIGLLGSIPISYHLDCTADYGTVTVSLEKDKEPELDKDNVPVSQKPDDLVNNEVTK